MKCLEFYKQLNEKLQDWSGRDVAERRKKKNKANKEKAQETEDAGENTT